MLAGDAPPVSHKHRTWCLSITEIPLCAFYQQLPQGIYYTWLLTAALLLLAIRNRGRTERTPQASKQNSTNSNHLALICLSDKPFKISGLSDRLEERFCIASRIFPKTRPLSKVVSMVLLPTAELRLDGSDMVSLNTYSVNIRKRCRSHVWKLNIFTYQMKPRYLCSFNSIAGRVISKYVFIYCRIFGTERIRFE